MGRMRYWSLLASVALLLAVAPRLGAQELPPQALGEDVVSVVVVDVTKIDAQSLSSAVQTILGEVPEEVQQNLEEYRGKHQQLVDAGAERGVMIFRQNDAGGEPDGVALLQVRQGADIERLTTLLKESAKEEVHVTPLSDRWLQITDRADVPPLSETPGANQEHFSTALRQAGDAPITVVMIPNDEMRAQIDQQMAQVPPQGQEFLRSLKNLRWMAWSTRLGDTPSVSANFEMPAAEGAQQLQTQMTNGVKLLPQFAMQVGMFVPELAQPAQDLANALQNLEFKQEGNAVTVQLTTEQLQAIGKAVKPLVEMRLQAAAGLHHEHDGHTHGMEMEVEEMPAQQ